MYCYNIIGWFIRLDGITTDWTNASKFQNKVNVSNRSLNFRAFMQTRSLPTCPAVFSFLQSTTTFGMYIYVVYTYMHAYVVYGCVMKYLM